MNNLTIKPNEKQLECINNIEGKFLALAGPGTGKTFTLVQRIKFMLLNGIREEKILCLTFSDSAAMELRQRLEKELKKTIQRSLQIIFQDSSVSLNPRMNIEDCMAEPFIIHKLFPNKKERQKKIAELLESVGMDSSFLQKIPAELSGGQKQRVCIARSLALEPELIIADEPVSSLDVSVQAQIINLFMKLRKEKNFSLLFIAHDLSMVQYLCDRVGVLYAGKLVEVAPADELFNSPMHPYTKMLLSAIPQPDPITEKNKTFTPQTNFLIPNHAKLKEISPDHFVLEE